jgi:hypothetical protein
MATFESAALEAQMECSKAITVLARYSDEIAPNLHAHVLMAGVLDYLSGCLGVVPLSLAGIALTHLARAQEMLQPFDDAMGMEIKRLYDEERREHEPLPPW